MPLLIDPFIKILLDDHRRYLINQCNLIANSISDKNWARVKHNMSRHIKFNINPASLVESIVSPCGFLPAAFPINFGSCLQLPVQYIIVPVEEHATVAEFIYLNPIWTKVATERIENVGHRIMLKTPESSELCGLIYLESDGLKCQFKGDPERYWNESVERLRINNYSHVYYGETKHE